jgi:hypothetical protein
MLSPNDPQPEPAPPRTLRWRSWPLTENLPRSILRVALFLGLCALVGVGFGGWEYALLAMVLVGLSLLRFFLPTTYVLDEQAATARVLGPARKLPWSQVRRVGVGPAGVFLSPFERPSRLDSFRGMFLRFAHNADEVTSFVRKQTDVAS